MTTLFACTHRAYAPLPLRKAKPASLPYSCYTCSITETRSTIQKIQNSLQWQIDTLKAQDANGMEALKREHNVYIKANHEKVVKWIEELEAAMEVVERTELSAWVQRWGEDQEGLGL